MDSQPSSRRRFLKHGSALAGNDIIGESDVIDNGFIPERLEEINDAHQRGCHLGHCP